MTYQQRSTLADYSILALAPQDWHGQWVGRQQLLSRIGSTCNVLYSSGGWFVWDRHSAEWKGTPFSGCITRTDNVWLDKSPRYLMRWPRNSTVDRSIMRLQASRWRAWLRNTGNPRVLAYICHPNFLPYLEWLDADRVVYNAYDLFDHMPGWSAEVAEREQQLLRIADLVFCPTEMVASGLSNRVPREIKILLNGADVNAFFQTATQGADVPADLARIPRPRIGWTGSLHPQIDYGLIATLARRRPDWNFVFVGGKVEFTESSSEQAYNECCQLPNVHFLGYKHHKDVPGYVLNMDVNAMCYRLSDATWVKCAYPLKLHEYLASGRPIVSVALQMLQIHSDVIRFATGPDEWESAIADALLHGGAGTAEQRMAIARENSWDARAAQLIRWLAEITAQSDVPKRTPAGQTRASLA